VEGRGLRTLLTMFVRLDKKGEELERNLGEAK
jgi:hypothetical protein